MKRLRLAHTSDLHLDERGRLDDVQTVLEAFIHQAAAAKVDLIVVAGDLYERRSTPVERLAAVEFLTSAAEVAPVFIVKGNHDQPGDIVLFRSIRSRHPIFAEEQALVCRPIAGFMAIPIPWFDKAQLAATLGPDTDAEEVRLRAVEAANGLLVGAKLAADEAKRARLIPIVLSHALVAGSEVSTGQTLIGIGVEFTPHDLLETGAEYVGLGHVHLRQEWFGGRVCYSGSPARHNFGEMEEKGWRLVEFNDEGKFVSNTFMPLPARKMVHINLDFREARHTPASFDGTTWFNGCQDALVRIRYTTTPERLASIDASALERAARAAGAHEVKVEAVVEASTRSRAGAIATAEAETLAEKLRHYIEAKGIEVAPGQIERLESKLEEVSR